MPLLIWHYQIYWDLILFSYCWFKKNIFLCKSVIHLLMLKKLWKYVSFWLWMFYYLLLIWMNMLSMMILNMPPMMFICLHFFQKRMWLMIFLLKKFLLRHFIMRPWLCQVLIQWLLCYAKWCLIHLSRRMKNLKRKKFLQKMWIFCIHLLNMVWMMHPLIVMKTFIRWFFFDKLELGENEWIYVENEKCQRNGKRFMRGTSESSFHGRF